MSGGKLVDILTCCGFFFAHCSVLPKHAACGCAFADSFACVSVTGRRKCSPGLPPTSSFSLSIASHAAHRSSLRRNHQWPRVPYRSVAGGPRSMACADRARAWWFSRADAVLRANARRGRTSAEPLAQPCAWPSHPSGIVAAPWAPEKDRPRKNTPQKNTEKHRRDRERICRVVLCLSLFISVFFCVFFCGRSSF